MSSSPSRSRSHSCDTRALPTHAGVALLLTLAAVALVAPACTDDNPSFVEPRRCADNESLYLQTFPGTHPDRLDVVILVEQSPDAAALQDALPAAAGAVIDALGDTDFRVGVLGSGEGGFLNATGACQGEGFVQATDADPASRLACLLRVPTEPEVARSGALGGLNQLVSGATDDLGFLRRDARLLVVIVAVNDDCTGLAPAGASREACEWQRGELLQVDALYQTLRNARPDVHAVAVAAIVGPLDGRVFPRDVSPEPACSGALGEALHGIRYREFAAQAAPWSTTESICGVADLGQSLADAITPLTRATESRYCLGRDVSGTLRSVVVVDPGRGLDQELTADDGDYAYLGSNAACAGSPSIVLDDDARRSFTATTEVEVYFCGQ